MLSIQKRSRYSIDTQNQIYYNLNMNKQYPGKSVALVEDAFKILLGKVI